MTLESAIKGINDNTTKINKLCIKGHYETLLLVGCYHLLETYSFSEEIINSFIKRYLAWESNTSNLSLCSSL